MPDHPSADAALSTRLRSELERIATSWEQQARSKFQAADRELAAKPAQEIEVWRALENAAVICTNHAAELRRLLGGGIE